LNIQSNIISVNLGARKKIQIRSRVEETGIYKNPVHDKIKINQLGLANDVIVDTKYHGGKDQAVYLYNQEDYSWWSRKLNRDLLPGTFGENLTLSSFGTSKLKIGDRFHINDIILEVTMARIPCATFAAKMKDPSFVKVFKHAKRPGAYTRVIKGGELQVGDNATFVPTPEDYPTVLELFELWYTKDVNSPIFKKALKAPIAERTKTTFESL
jgi:MOSC domain-containing protein YiiM